MTIAEGVPAASPRRPLVDTAVHIWWAHLDQPTEALEQFERMLAVDEQARAARIRLKEFSARFVAGRGILRAILGSYLGVAPDRVRFRYGSSGKPALADEFAASGLRFNLSHSHRLALYAVTREREVGVDLERVDPHVDTAGLVGRCFSPREQAEWSGLPDRTRGLAFLNGWTRKEACVKALGDGLTRPLEQVEVPLRPLPSLVAVPLDGEPEHERCILQDLTPPEPGYVAALAVQGGPVRVEAWRWPDDPAGRPRRMPGTRVPLSVGIGAVEGGHP